MSKQLQRAKALIRTMAQPFAPRIRRRSWEGSFPFQRPMLALSSAGTRCTRQDKPHAVTETITEPRNNIKKWRYLHVFRVKIPNSEAERQMHKKRHNTAKRKGPATASLNERSGCGVPVGNANLTTALCYALAKGPEPVWRPQSKAAEISGGSWL